MYKYNKDSSTGRSSIQQGKSRSLFNDDIMGARPKVYGGNTTILGSYAGVSTGIQERLRNMEAPFGSGGNFEATSYGKKWIEKPTK